MKTNLNLSLYLLLCVLFSMSACKKKDTIEGVLSGNGDYIEFKLDGTTHRIETSGVNSSDYVQSVTQYQTDTALNSNSFIVTLAHVKNLSSGLPPSALFRINQEAVFSPGNYVLPPFDISNPSDTLVTFIYVKADSSSYNFTTGPSNSGSIQLTKVNPSSGGKTEGTFSFNSVEHRDKSGNVISSNHIITDGKFRGTVL